MAIIVCCEHWGCMHLFELVFLYFFNLFLRVELLHSMLFMGFPGYSVVKNLPAVKETQETWVWSLGLGDPLEEGIAINSNILVRRIPWTEQPGRLQFRGLHRVWNNWSDLVHMHGISIFIFLRKLHAVLHSGLHEFTFPPRMYLGSLFSTALITFVSCRLWWSPCWQVWGDISSWFWFVISDD